MKIPIFESGPDKELLFTRREFHNMVTDFNFTATLNQTQQAYEFFGETVQGVARDTWQEILLDHDINGGVRDATGLPMHLGAFRDAHMSVESFNNQLSYMRNTNIPRLSSVKTWLRRLKAPNAYLPLMDAV